MIAGWMRMGEASGRLSSRSYALFLCGMFAGGAIDHLILVLKGDERTPYGVRLGVGANAVFAVLDATLAAAAYAAYRRWR